MTSKQLLFSFLSMTAVGVGLTGCTFLPSAGPSGYQVQKQSGHQYGEMSYHVLKLDDKVLKAVRDTSPHPACLAIAGRPMDESFKERGLQRFGAPLIQKISPGDLLQVSIIETDSRLFVPSLQSGQGAASPITSLPPQRLDESGEITIPYAGRVKVKDRLPNEVEAEIRDKLNSKSADAQVVVNVVDRKGGNMITVSGDVRAPMMVPISPAGSRVLDVISAAGGNPGDPFDYMVTVTRAEKNISEPLRTIFDNPSMNILLQAGDTVVLRKRPLNFLTFGATGKVSNFPIIVEDLNLVEALAISGGPIDNLANPSTIYVYRQETPEVLNLLGKKILTEGKATAPVIYRLQLNDPKGFFYATNFMVRDRDVIYYATSGSVGAMKFMALLNTLVGPAISGISAWNTTSLIMGR